MEIVLTHIKMRFEFSRKLKVLNATSQKFIKGFNKHVIVDPEMIFPFSQTPPINLNLMKIAIKILIIKKAFNHIFNKKMKSWVR